MYKRGISAEILPIALVWGLEYKTTIKKDLSINPRIEEGFDSMQIENILASVITALRLFQEGSVGINSYTQYIHSNIPIYTPFSIGLDIMGLYTSRPDYYLFDKKKSVKFKKFWNSFGEKLTKIFPRNKKVLITPGVPAY